MAKKPKSKSSSTASVKPKAETNALSKSVSVVPAFFQNTRLQGIIIFLFAFLLYANTLGHQWAQDDTVVITNNMFTQEGISGIPSIFGKDTFYGYFKIEGKASVVAGGRYRPLTVAMFAIVYQFFGMSPFPFHLLTVLLFAFLCFLLYITLNLLLRHYRDPGYGQTVSFATAMLFAALPVHSEVVANVKGCDEIVTLIGSLGALYFIVKAIDTRKLVYSILGSLSFFLALLAKENAVTFLLVIPLALVLFRKVSFDQVAKALGSLLAAFFLFFVMRMPCYPSFFPNPRWSYSIIRISNLKMENG
jgi:hypothetical protein